MSRPLDPQEESIIAAYKEMDLKITEKERVAWSEIGRHTLFIRTEEDHYIQCKHTNKCLNCTKSWAR